MKGNRAFATRYNRPGAKNPFSPSASQVLNREFYASAIAVWQAKSQAQKDYWNDLVKERKLSMSGWNLFYQDSFNKQVETEGLSIYGTREYSYFEYGKQ